MLDGRWHPAFQRTWTARLSRAVGEERGQEVFSEPRFGAAVLGRMTDTMTLLTSSDSSVAKRAAEGSAVADT